MAHPPRIPVLIPDEQPVIYFLTLCVEGRKPVLANEKIWGAVQASIERLDRWNTLSALATPDHLHVLTAPHDRQAAPSEYSRWLKRWVRSELKATWRWQPGVFDRLLREDESSQEKWTYIRENPVTSGLAKRWQDWPYRFGFEDF